MFNEIVKQFLLHRESELLPDLQKSYEWPLCGHGLESPSLGTSSDTVMAEGTGISQP